MLDRDETGGDRCMSIFFFRNDDVRDTLDEALVRLTDIFIEYGIPITHAVEPLNVTEEVTAWLIEKKKNHPRLIELIQHGLDHSVKISGPRKGEFGGNRTYQEQFDDLQQGMHLMDEKFGDLWFRGFCFPYGPYNPAAMKALNDLGFKLVNSHFNIRPSRRLFYGLGHLLRRGYLFGKRVSWNLQYRPGTSLFEVDMNVSFIKKYHSEGTDCDFYTLDQLKQRTTPYLRYRTIGVLFHHRYHIADEHFDLVRRYLDWVQSLPRVRFMNMQEIFERFSKGTVHDS